MGRPRVGIIIPAFNEQDTILPVINSIMKYGIPIVVNDGSTDNTSHLLNQTKAEVVSHSFNLGYEAALNSGFKRAVELNCDIVLTFDADGQHDAELVNRFISSIGKGNDIVVGIRSRKQRMSESLFSIYTKYKFGIKDPLCGMKAYRVSVYKEIGFFDTYKSVGTELMIVAASRGYRLSQVDFVVKPRLDKSRYGMIIKANYKILRALFISIFYLK